MRRGLGAPKKLQILEKIIKTLINAYLEWPGIEPGTVRVESSALDHSAILIDMENDENCSRYSSKTDIFLHSTTSHTLRYH